MKPLLALLLLPFLMISCKKDDAPQDRVINGVNVTVATASFNEFRTQGITGYPAVAAVTWNDTLSTAAYNFAKQKSEDINTPSNVYFLSNGQTIFNFPPALNYSRTANFALHYGYPADADVKTIIAAGFSSTDAMIKNGLMNGSAKEFGIGQFGGKWYLIMSN